MKPDNNIAKDLGRRIRERRKKLGITQAQLCGDYMTRNMLSRIETGDANPSLETLLFISQKLKTPPSFFLCRDIKEEAEYTKTVRIKDARRMLGTGQYRKCIDICSDLPSDDDEVSFIVVTAETMWAANAFDKGELREALLHLENAKTALHQTVYMYSEMLSQIRFLSHLITCLSKGEAPSIESLPVMAPVFFTKDRFLYVIALASEEFPKNCLGSQSIYRTHLEAKALMNGSNYSEAAPLLSKVRNEAPDAFARYYALLDLEICSGKLDDYKSAYEYARQRMELHDKYSI
ncbi:MAG: helix-turn-helix transcriptional regulator [Ruminococcaceae bacterium]|nr:helix-turn-helix transcriptional regulator [Oscillospiraceae bacterium]